MVAIFTGNGFGFEFSSAAVLGKTGLLGQASQGRGGEGVHVNAATGNLVLQKQDEYLVGEARDVDVTRTYNSLTSLADDNNDKWRQSTDRRVYLASGTVNQAGSIVNRVSGDGAEVAYEWDATNSVYVTKDGGGAYDTITYGSGSWTWVDGEENVFEVYDETTTKITAEWSKDFSTLRRYYYDGSGRLDKINSTYGGEISYTYDGSSNRITSVVTGYHDHNDNNNWKTLTRVRYAYDGSNRLQTVTVDLTPGDNSVSDGITYSTTYGYDTAGRVNSITQSDGSQLQIAYDTSGRVETLTQTVVAGTTPVVRETNLTYYTGYTVIEDSAGNSTRLDYDGDGNLKKITAPPAYSGASSQVVEFTYNANGDLLSVEDGLGNTTTYSNYNAIGLAETITDRSGATVTRDYGSVDFTSGAVTSNIYVDQLLGSNKLNVLLSETRTGVAESGWGENLTTRNVYDNRGRLRYSISAEGRVTQFAWNSYGSVTSETVYAENAYTTAGIPSEATMNTWVAGLSGVSWVERTEYTYDARQGLTSTRTYSRAEADGTTSATDGSTTVHYIYDQAGQLLQTHAEGQNTVSYVYDGMGRVTAMTDAHGGTTTFAFTDTSGTITTVTTTDDGHMVTETYNRGGDLVSRTDSGTHTNNGSTTYQYDELGRARITTRLVDTGVSVTTYTIYDDAGRHVGDVDQNGYLTEYRYDANNRLVGTIDYHTAISSPNLSALSDPDTHPSIATLRSGLAHAEDTASWTIYDNEGRVRQTIAGDGSTSISSYDPSGRLQQVKSYANKIALGTVQGFKTTAPTSVITSMGTSADDSLLRYFYSKDGLLIGTLDAEGHVVKNSYDQAGRLVASTAYANATTAGSLATASYNSVIAGVNPSSARDRTTRYVNDSQGRLRFEIDAQFRIARYDYDTAGLLIRTTVYADAISSATSDFSFDNIDSLADGLQSTSDKRISHTVRDAAGRVAYGINAEGAVTGYVYDSRGRATREVRYASAYGGSQYAVANLDNWSASHLSDSGNRITRTWYTERGEAAYVVDAEGHVQLNSYDKAGRLVERKTWPNAITVSDATTFSSVASQAASAGTAVIRSWAYDSLDRVIRETDGMGHQTTYTYHGTTSLVNTMTRAANGTALEQSVRTTVYDGAGRAVEITEGDGSGAGHVNAVTEYAYDGRGELSEFTDANQKVTRYEYDLNGRLVGETRDYGGINAEIGYEYNGFGEAWKITDAEGNVTYRWYDQLGRVTAERDAENYLTTTTYTAFGDVATVKRWFTAVGGTAQIATAPTGSGSGATTSFTYDDMGRVLTSTDALSEVETYTYNAFGDRVTATDRLGEDTAYVYDRLGQLIEESVEAPTTTLDASGNPFSSGARIVTKYGYDARGNVIQIQQGYKTSGAAAFTVSSTTGYAYDAAGRLSEESVNAATTIYNSSGTAIAQGVSIVSEYDYDARGNRTELKEGYRTSGGTFTALRTTAYEHDDADRITKTTFDQVTVLDDNMVSTASATPTELFEYDDAGNVIKFTDQGGARTYSYYDGLNRKIVEIRELSASERSYTAYTYDENGNLATTRVYEASVAVPSGPGGNPPSAPGSSNYRETKFTYDGLNRMVTSEVVNPAGNLITSGSWNGSSYTTTTSGNLITSYQYDAQDNVVKAIDANGNATWNWYDALGRNQARLDGEKYLTKWTYDDAGNVLSETRYATQFAGTPSLSSVPSVSTNSNDRTTIYTYDVNGNRRSEKRTGVAAWSVNPTTGQLSSAGTDAILEYSYNALGQVAVKKIAGTTVASYQYDGIGRLTSEKAATFTDANGSQVTPEHTFNYDALGNMTRRVQEGQSGTYSASDRVSLYIYGEGGRLVQRRDAEGTVHSYFYDAAGRLKKDQYARTVHSSTSHTSSSTTTVTEAQTTTYDKSGRAIRKAVYSSQPGSFQLIDYASFKYNAFGEVIEQGSGSTGSGIASGSARYQEKNTYDAGGRLIATNSGDGVWKFFGYDKAGNQTLAITSAGESTFSSSTTVATARSKIGETDVNGTYTVYDGRNLALQVVEEGRELTTSGTQTLTTSRTYNAFGEVASETDARLNLTTYTYNTMGRMIRSESPGVEIKLENGGSNWVKPSQDYYYDLGGRLIAMRDAEGTYASGGSSGSPKTKSADTGNLTTYALLAGTGYDGSQSLIATEFHADGGKKQTLYDIMGDARVIRDELYNSGSPLLHVTEQTFDKLGRLVTLKHNRTAATSGDNDRLVDNFAYDELGQLIARTNNQYGASVIEKTAYDALGRVTGQTDMAGHRTFISHAWDGTLSTSGLTAYGGWVETAKYDTDLSGTATGGDREMVIKTDIYGRELYKNDLGSHVTTYAYDAGGRMASSSVGSTTATFNWYNTGWLKQNDGPNGIETYTYDKTGNRLTQLLKVGATTIASATTTYDAHGRMTTFDQTQSTYSNGGTSFTTPAVSNDYYYDANGNIRQTISTHRTINSSGVMGSSDVTETYWFRYDAMNRLVVDRGTLSGTAGDPGTIITRGVDGITSQFAGQEIVYDAAGRRTAILQLKYTAGLPGYLYEFRENYFYDGAGRLTDIKVTYGNQVQVGSGDPILPAPAASPSDPSLSVFTYDKMGRQTAQNDYSGTNVVYDRDTNYDAAGKITSEASWAKKTDGKTYSASSTNNYVASGEYFLGAVASVAGTTGVTGQGTKNTSTVNTYQWWDGTIQNTIAYKPDTSQSTTFNTTFTYNGMGQLTQVYVADGRPRNVWFKLNAEGQIIRRDEKETGGSVVGPHEIWYRFAGRELGYTGNNYTDNPTALASVGDRLMPIGTGAFHNGQASGASYTDFTQSYEALNSYDQGSAAGSYTVQTTGESLRSIALSLWGDASLWYKLADANGLQAETRLVEGQRLTVPAGVARSSHNASTLKPYDANEVIGEVSPTTPKPKKNNKCGVFGQILIAAIAIAVTVIAPFGAGPIAQIANAALGSVVSQGVGVATGIQDKFSFKGVALSALSAGIAPGNPAGSFIGKVASGAASNALLQGVAVATGLQSKFNWAGVAAAGIGAGVGALAADRLGASGGFFASRIGGDIAYSSASLLANAATRSALTGTSFGDNITRALPDTIGGVAGRALGSAANGVLARAKAARQAAEASPVSRSDAIEDAVAQQALSKAKSHTVVSAGQIDDAAASGINAWGDIVVTADPYLKYLVSPHMMSAYSFETRYLPNEPDGLVGRTVLASRIVSQQRRSFISSTAPTAINGAARSIGLVDRLGSALSSYSSAYGEAQLAQAAANDLGPGLSAISQWASVPITTNPILRSDALIASPELAAGMYLPNLYSSGWGVDNLNYRSHVTQGELAIEALGLAIGAFKGARVLAAARSGRAASSKVWELNPFQRGQQIERALGHNLPNNFPGIDRFENGLVTSIKSLDLDASTYQSASTLNRTLSDYVDKVAGFQGRTWAGVRIRSQDITARSLDLAIPHGGSAAQQAIINQTIKYGASRGVTVNVIPFP